MCRAKAEEEMSEVADVVMWGLKGSAEAKRVGADEEGGERVS